MDIEEKIKVQQKAINQLMHRMIVLENRIEEIDRIKMKRPSVYSSVEERPMLHAKIDLWRHPVMMVIILAIGLSGCVCGPDYAHMTPGVPYHKKDVPFRCWMRGPVL